VFSLFSYLKDQEFGVLNLDVRGNHKQIVATQSAEMIKGDKVWGNFRSKYKNLGILSVRFYNQDRDSDDTLIFRLKEEGQSRWLYQAKYETDQFLPHKHFPFGFPLIKESDAKTFVFELESLRGATGSGIIVDTESYPIFVAKSSFTKADLLSNKSNLLYFLSNKLLNIFGDPEVLRNIFSFFLPFLLYIFYLFTVGVSYQYPIILILAISICDIIWLPTNYDFVFIGVLFFWGLISGRYRYDSRIAAVFTLGFLMLTTLASLMQQNVTEVVEHTTIVEKLAVWTYLFLFLTVTQQIYDMKKNTRYPLTLPDFLRNFHKFSVDEDFWLRKVPNQVINLITCCVALFLIIRPVVKVSNTLTKFVAFYPSEYMEIYIKTLLVPELIAFSFLTLLYFYKNRTISNSKYLLIILLFIFNLVSGKIISNGISFQDEPRVLYISPSQTNEAWTDVVVTGKNFRDKPFVGKIVIDGIEQGVYVLDWTDQMVVFRTSPEITKSGMLQLVPFDRKPSNQVPFSYNFK
jgi:hypothetical protein